MKPSDDIHWTDDPELIERFVLHQLNPDQRNELEDHLRICEVCKRALRSEQVLLAGIRRSGRESFRAELGKKLATVKPSGTPWPHILTAAAMIILLTGIGIYNRWFQTVQPLELPAPATSSSEQPHAESIQPGTTGNELTAEAFTQSGQVETSQRTLKPPQSQAPTTTLSETHKGPIASTYEAREEKTPVLPATREKAEAGEAAAARVAADAQGPSDGELKEESPQITYWVVGDGSNAAAASPTLQSGEPQGSQQTMKKRAETYSALAGEISERLVLEQKPLSSLPPAQQTVGGPDKLIASIRRERDTLILTLFDDRPLVPEASLVRRGDTLIVQTSDMTYSFPIPPPLLQRNQTTPAR